MTKVSASGRTFDIKLIVAVLGCAISVGAAVIGGVVKSRTEDAAAAQKSELASIGAEMLRRDRLFDIARGYDAMWQQTRLQLRILAGVKQWVFSPAVESIESQLADALTWGYEAAHGKAPDQKLNTNFATWARVVAMDEARTADPTKSPSKSDISSDQTTLVEAVSGITSELSQRVSQYWENRNTFLATQEALRAQVRVSEAKLRRIEGYVLALQILGLMVVLMKDLVRSEK